MELGRLFNQMTMDELALKSGVSKGNISKIESGKVNPTLDTIIAICKALNVKPSEILRGMEL